MVVQVEEAVQASVVPDRVLDRSLADTDPEVNRAISAELTPVFPGQQGGPLEHVIAAKAVAFKLAAESAFRERQERTLAGARLLAERLLAPDSRAAGVNVVSGGTDVHLVLVDLRESALDGRHPLYPDLAEAGR